MDTSPEVTSKTVKILGSQCADQSYFVGFKDKPWQGYMVTVSGAEYTALVHMSSGCYNGSQLVTGPCEYQGGYFLMTWLEADHVTAKRYDCNKSGFVEGCVRAVAKPGRQSFGDDIEDLAKGIYELSGAKDIVDCATGSGVASCAWAAAAVVPFGLGRAAKALQAGAKVGDEAGEAIVHLDWQATTGKHASVEVRHGNDISHTELRGEQGIRTMVEDFSGELVGQPHFGDFGWSVALRGPE